MTAADLHPDTVLPRPGTCCGVCPPIAGGGWDCTCPGMPGCPVNSPAADDYADLARRAQAAQELTPGEWVAGDGWVYTPPVHDDDHRLASVLGMKYADRDRANAEHARAQRNAEFIAAANPATILRLLDECASLQEDASVATQRAEHAEAERDEARANVIDAMALVDQLAARLAAVEALAKGWAVMAAQAMDADTREWLTAASRSVLAALAAPTNTTKETS